MKWTVISLFIWTDPVFGVIEHLQHYSQSQGMHGFPDVLGLVVIIPTEIKMSINREWGWGGGQPLKAHRSVNSTAYIRLWTGKDDHACWAETNLCKIVVEKLNASKYLQCYDILLSNQWEMSFHW